ncbi:hypothetical protein Tco_0741985 [Tanacetum coccineum]
MHDSSGEVKSLSSDESKVINDVFIVLSFTNLKFFSNSQKIICHGWEVGDKGSLSRILREEECLLEITSGIIDSLDLYECQAFIPSSGKSQRYQKILSRSPNFSGKESNRKLDSNWRISKKISINFKAKRIGRPWYFRRITVSFCPPQVQLPPPEVTFERPSYENTAIGGDCFQVTPSVSNAVAQEEQPEFELFCMVGKPVVDLVCHRDADGKPDLLGLKFSFYIAAASRPYFWICHDKCCTLWLTILINALTTKIFQLRNNHDETAGPKSSSLGLAACASFVRAKTKCACCVRGFSSKSQPSIAFVLLWSQSQPLKILWEWCGIANMAFIQLGKYSGEMSG